MTTKERLENMLIDKGLIVDLLWGVKGQWRKTIMDVMRWEAQCRNAEGRYVHVGSWYTMTECVRRGFDLIRDERSSYMIDYEAVAHDRKEKHGGQKAQGIRGVRRANAQAGEGSAGRLKETSQAEA